MSDNSYQTMARSDFGRLRTRETFMRILSLLKARHDEMLSLGDVRSLLRPDSETYRGMQTIPIERSSAARAATRTSTGRSFPGTTS